MIFHNSSSSKGFAMSSLLANLTISSYSCYRINMLKSFHFVRRS
jgi:hypothetical protein